MNAGASLFLPRHLGASGNTEQGEAVGRWKAGPRAAVLLKTFPFGHNRPIYHAHTFIQF